MHPSTKRLTVEIRKIAIERYCPQYPEERFFFERDRTRTARVLSANKGSLLVFLATICRIAMVDKWRILPAGLIMYALAIPFAIELTISSDATDDEHWLEAIFRFGGGFIRQETRMGRSHRIQH